MNLTLIIDLSQSIHRSIRSDHAILTTIDIFSIDITLGTSSGRLASTSTPISQVLVDDYGGGFDHSNRLLLLLLLLRLVIDLTRTLLSALRAFFLVLRGSLTEQRTLELARYSVADSL